MAPLELKPAVSGRLFSLKALRLVATLLGAAIFAAALMLVDAARASSATDDAKRGYWWYEEPPADEEEAFPDPVAPVIPPPEGLARMSSKDLGELLHAQLDYATVVQTVEAVEDYYRLQDLARRRARSFASLAGVVMLENPDLNAKSAYPTTNEGHNQRVRLLSAERSTRLQRERNEFALLMLSRESCPYCKVQWGVLQFFADKTGWKIRDIDLDANPAAAARFNVTTTPVTVIIRRDTDDWSPVAVGATTYESLSDDVYRTVRLLKGEIDPRQFYTPESDDGGFFDPAAGLAPPPPSADILAAGDRDR